MRVLRIMFRRFDIADPRIGSNERIEYKTGSTLLALTRLHRVQPCWFSLTDEMVVASRESYERATQGKENNNSSGKIRASTGWFQLPPKTSHRAKIGRKMLHESTRSSLQLRFFCIGETHRVLEVRLQLFLRIEEVYGFFLCHESILLVILRACLNEDIEKCVFLRNVLHKVLFIGGLCCFGD